MSSKEWMTVGLAAVFANPILLAIVLILGAVAFFTIYLTLAVLGLVSAVIYALFGLCLVWLVGVFSKSFLAKYWQIILIVPLLFALGYVADHSSMLSFLSMAQKIDVGSGFGSMSFMDGTYVLMFGPYLIAIFALITAVAVLGVTLVRMKDKYKWVR